MATNGNCGEREKLLDRYREAVMDLSAKGIDVSNAASSYNAETFDQHWEQCEKAREECTTLRRQLTAHIEAHGCVFGPISMDEYHLVKRRNGTSDSSSE
jgi:hypothetical protein